MPALSDAKKFVEERLLPYARQVAQEAIDNNSTLDNVAREKLETKDYERN
jgi:hypothetical protein